MKEKMGLWSKVRRVWVTLGVLAFLGFAGWSLLAYRPRPDARRALLSDEQVTVVRADGFWSFSSSQEPGRRRAGLLFFSGALVDAVAYAPLARAVASAGYPVLLVELPRRGAFGGADDARVLDRARMVHGDPSCAAGLVLIGTSHPRDFSLAGAEFPITKVYGTRDGIADVEKIEETRDKLPLSTNWVRIEGGNHPQFGSYGFQPGDHFATISRERQQELTVRTLLAALEAAARPEGSRPTQETLRPTGSAGG